MQRNFIDVTNAVMTMPNQPHIGVECPGEIWYGT